MLVTPCSGSHSYVEVAPSLKGTYRSVSLAGGTSVYTLQRPSVPTPGSGLKERPIVTQLVAPPSGKFCQAS